VRQLTLSSAATTERSGSARRRLNRPATTATVDGGQPDGGGDLRLPSSIPSEGTKRAARRSSLPASIRSSRAQSPAVSEVAMAALELGGRRNGGRRRGMGKANGGPRGRALLAVQAQEEGPGAAAAGRRGGAARAAQLGRYSARGRRRPFSEKPPAIARIIRPL
jgi:hypothetical protein